MVECVNRRDEVRYSGRIFIVFSEWWDKLCILGAALWPVKYLQVKKQEMNENNEWTNECMKWEGGTKRATTTRKRKKTVCFYLCQEYSIMIFLFWWIGISNQVRMWIIRTPISANITNLQKKNETNTKQ